MGSGRHASRTGVHAFACAGARTRCGAVMARAFPGGARRELRAALIVLMLGLWMVLSAGTARGQAVKGGIWSVGIGGMDGKDGVYREGSWVPVQVKLQNMTPSPFVGHLAVEQIDLDGDKVMTVGPEFVLQPGVDERSLWTYFWPRPDYATLGEGGITRVLVLDKGRQVVTSLTTPLQGNVPISAARAILPDDDLVRRSTRMVVVLGKDFAGWKSFEGMYGGTEAVKPVLVTQPSALPDNVLGLDGVDVIVWEADAVKVSDIAPEFQLRAMLEWVNAGGHLIISVGTQGQEFLKAGSRLADAMPLAITGTRDIKAGDLGSFRPWGAILLDNSKAMVQVTGNLKAGARVVMDQPEVAEKGQPSKNALVVTGLYGQGAITVVTLDVCHPELKAKLGERDWISFWTRAAGWRQRTPEASGFFTAAQVDQNRKLEVQRPQPLGLNQTIEKMPTNPTPIKLGTAIPQDVDVKDVTVVRILVALAFLALYWLLAGPVGHMILRQYKVMQWSWWIFGGVVVVATAIAGGVVLVLHVKAYDVRHRTFVLGTVNGKSATAVSFYGIYAPVSGPVDIRLAEGSGGLNYVAPMCMPTPDTVKSYADPQSYDLSAEAPWQVSPVFRNTLKKMQGRWTGPMAGITGSAQFVAGSEDAQRMLAGSLTNNSGYELRDVQLIVHVPSLSHSSDVQDRDLLYQLGRGWRSGETVDLATDLKLDTLTYGPLGPQPVSVNNALEVMGWKIGGEHKNVKFGMMKQGRPKTDEETALEQRGWPRDDLLYLLGDARNIDYLDDSDRCELVRGVGRMTECTKALHAAGALVVAYAENVRSPTPLIVNGKPVEGKGSVTFAWTLPIAGQAPGNPQMQPATRSILSVQPERP